MNSMVWYGSWLIVAAISLAMIVAMFFQDLKRVNDREPLRIPFIGEAHPGDATYPLALIEVFGPYITLCAGVAFFFGFGLYTSLFAA